MGVGIGVGVAWPVSWEAALRSLEGRSEQPVTAISITINKVIDIPRFINKSLSYFTFSKTVEFTPELRTKILGSS
jgi:hypothetical protein